MSSPLGAPTPPAYEPREVRHGGKGPPTVGCRRRSWSWSTDRAGDWSTGIGACRHLLDHEESLWTFVHHEGVEPTNNSAERVLRHGVLLRNCSFGTQSLAGSRFVERVLTAEATLRQQGRSVVEFVVDAVRARLLGGTPPSLLPSPELLAAGSLVAYKATG